MKEALMETGSATLSRENLAFIECPRKVDWLQSALKESGILC